MGCIVGGGGGGGADPGGGRRSTTPKAKKRNPDYPFVPAENIHKDIKSIFNDVKVLGKGASCSVNKFQHKETKEFYAMKIMEQDDRWNPILFKQEVHILSNLKHRNIMGYHDCYMDKENFYVALELCKGGELFDKIKELSKFAEADAAKYIRTIVSAIAHCHDNNIVHRDLKPENIVFRTEKKEELVLIDFGDAKEIRDDEKYEDFVGTAYYLAPECIRDRKGWELKKSDMWTIGVITYVCLTGKPPFHGKDNKSILRRIIKSEVRWPKSPKLSENAKHFISSLLKKQPKERLSAADCLKHPWLVQGGASKADLGKKVLENLADYSKSSKLKKVLVRMLAREMDDYEKDELRQQFNMIDKDGSGLIDKAELMRFIQGTGVTEFEADEQAQAMMSSLDLDGDGVVSYEEFENARMSKKLHDNEVIKKEFQKIDKDGSGYIEADELNSLFNWKLGKGVLATMIAEIDTNGDGQISLEEFTAAMKKGSFADNLVVDKRKERAKLQEIAKSIPAYDQYNKDEAEYRSKAKGRDF